VKEWGGTGDNKEEQSPGQRIRIFLTRGVFQKEGS